MATSVVTIPKLCHMTQVKELLRSCKISDNDRNHADAVTHHAFPVVNSKTSARLVGLVTREQLECAVVAADIHGEHTFHMIHILKYADRSPLTVFPNTRLSRAYTVFQKLGMRHLPVCDTNGEVVGMITRKNLMHYLLTDQDKVELMHIRRVQRGVREYLEHRRQKSDKIFDAAVYDPQNSNNLKDLMSLVELDAAVTRHMTVTLGLTWENENHTLEDILVECRAMISGKIILNRSEFDSVLAAARRFDAKKRREKEYDDNGTR